MSTSTAESAPTARAGGRAGRAHLLSVLRAQCQAMTVDEIAECLGLHTNTVRQHLDDLVQAGVVRREPKRGDGRGRPRLVYTASPVPEFELGDSGPLDAEAGYRLLAEILAGHVEGTARQPAEEAAATARSWGRMLAARLRSVAANGTVTSADAATDELAELLGFSPRASGVRTTVELHRCPFGQTAERHSAVVCAVHLGLMQGALDERGGPLQATSVEPFVTPQTCLARLAARTAVPEQPADSRAGTCLHDPKS